MSGDHTEPSIKKRLGEFLILGLYLVLDLVHIWPTHHFYALVAAFVGFAALLLLDGGFSTKQIVATLACVGVGCVVIYFGAAATERPDETEIIGTLQPSNDATPPNGCDNWPGTVTPDEIKVLIGTNVFHKRGIGKMTAIAIGRSPNVCPVLTMERRPDGI